MDDMQQKITYYRDKSENIEKLKEDLDEVRSKFFIKSNVFL